MAFQPINQNKENGVSQASAPAPKTPTTTPASSRRAVHRQQRHDPYKVQHALRARARGYRAPVAASPVTSDVDMQDAPSTSASVDASRFHIKFPAVLPRPIPREIDTDALVGIDRDLANVPLEYVHAKIRESGASMLCSIANNQTVQCNAIPTEMEVTLNTEPSNLPTHIFAVWDRASAGRRVQVYPVHDIVFASMCTSFADLPASKPTRTTTEDGSVKVSLPVVSVGVPHRESFSHLQHFLYTGRKDRLLAFLLPQPRLPGITPQQTPRHFAQTYTPSVIMNHVLRVHAVWSNACALGVVDDELWKIIQVSWALLMQTFKEAEQSGVTVEQP